LAIRFGFLLVRDSTLRHCLRVQAVAGGKGPGALLRRLELRSKTRRRTGAASGGGVEFMRGFAEKTYGIPPEQVVGSSGKTEFKLDEDGNPEIIKDAAVEFVDDGPGKPLGINRFIGHRPIFAFGNSDGDQQILEWTAAGEGLRFAGLVHHTDADREYAYDRSSPVGRLDKALDEAASKGWTVVDMKDDWKTVFANEAERKP